MRLWKFEESGGVVPHNFPNRTGPFKITPETEIEPTWGHVLIHPPFGMRSFHNLAPNEP